VKIDNSIVDINQSLVDDGLVDKEKIGGTNYYWSFPAKKDRLMEIQYHATIKEMEQLQKTLDDVTIRLIDAKRGREDHEEGCHDDDNDDNDNDEKNHDTITTNTKSNRMGTSNDENKNPNVEDDESAGNPVTKNVVDHSDTKHSHDHKLDENNLEPPSKKQKRKNGMTRHEKLQTLQQIQNEKLQIQKEIDALKEYDPIVIANYEKELDYVTKAAHRWTDNIFNCKSYLMKKRNMDKKDANRILGITDTFDCKLLLLLFVAVESMEGKDSTLNFLFANRLTLLLFCFPSL
jgi:Leucine zipper with capping helix domain/Mnd1 HTH domain